MVERDTSPCGSSVERSNLPRQDYLVGGSQSGITIRIAAATPFQFLDLSFGTDLPLPDDDQHWIPVISKWYKQTAWSVRTMIYYVPGVLQ
jgi:hypothetical protein